MTGSVVLAKAFHRSMPSHVMQYIKVSTMITIQWKKSRVTFFLETTDEKTKLHLLNRDTLLKWDTITSRKI